MKVSGLTWLLRCLYVVVTEFTSRSLRENRLALILYGTDLHESVTVALQDSQLMRCAVINLCFVISLCPLCILANGTAIIYTQISTLF